MKFNDNMLSQHIVTETRQRKLRGLTRGAKKKYSSKGIHPRYIWYMYLVCIFAHLAKFLLKVHVKIL